MSNTTITPKPIEIFCGTGGVGKTTLATSRALYLASTKHNVLLITIDPAKRLKEILDLKNSHAGKVKKIKSSIFPQWKNNKRQFSFDALLMSPRSTLERMCKENDTMVDFDNHILTILTRPHGGTNEVMSIIELQHHSSLNKYDVIVLDTPPGKHFIDFLQASEKIQHFFHKSFVEIFKYLGKSFSESSTITKSKNVITLIVSSGIKKLLGYLESVTGSTFVEEFIEAVVAIYKNKDTFLEALSFQQELKDIDCSNWILVTSVEQQKLLEANKLQDQVINFMHGDNYLAINKCLSNYLEGWEPPKDSEQIKIKKSMLNKEEKLKKYAKNHFTRTLEFPEILRSSPQDQVAELSKNWKMWKE